MRQVQNELDKAGKKGNELNDSLRKVSAIDVTAIANSFQNLNNRLNEASQPGIDFQAQLAEVEAITGVTGKSLDDLGDKARATAKVFGGDASAQLEAYKTVLSRFGPDIAQSPEALKAMGIQIQTLSKTMNGDAVGATNALTTAMLQYQVNLSDPLEARKEMANMMNVMAAGAKYGAAEVPQISAALEQSGVQAKLAKLSFEETNAAIQAMAEGGKYGSEAGVALRNVLTTISAPDALSGDAVKILKLYGINMKAVSDTSKPFSERLKLLGPIQNDLNALTAVFGRENSANAQILIRSGESQAELTKKIEGTNTATEQASVIMDTHKEKMARIKAWIDDVKISFFNVTGSILPFVNGATGAISVLADLKNASAGIKLLRDGFKSLEIAQKLSAVATKVAAGFQWLLNAAMSANPIGIVVVALAALAAGLYYAYQKSETFRAAIQGLISVGKVLMDVFVGVGKTFIGALTFNPALIAEGISQAGEAVNKIRTEGLGKIFKDGYNESIKQSREDEKKKSQSEQSTSSFLAGKTPENKNLPLSPSTKQKDMSIEGSGGGGKSISMHLDIKNYFNVGPGTDVRKIADQVIGMVNDRLRDGALSI